MKHNTEAKMFDWPQTFSQLEASFRAEDKTLGHKNVKICKNGGVKRHDIWWIAEKSVTLQADIMCAAHERAYKI